MANPKAAIDTLLETETLITKNIVLSPLTIARYALLELVDSPFINGKELNISNTIPTAYIMTHSIKDLKGYNSKNIDKLEEVAMEWSESLEVDDMPKIIKHTVDELLRMNKVAPDSTEDVKKNH